MPQDATPIYPLHDTLLHKPADEATYRELVALLLPAEAAKYSDGYANIHPLDHYGHHQRIGLVLDRGGLPSLALLHYQHAADLAQQPDRASIVPQLGSTLVAILPQLQASALDAGRLALAESSIRQCQAAWEQIEVDRPHWFRWNGMTRNVFETQNDRARLLVLRGEYAAAMSLLDSIEGFYPAMGTPVWTLDIRARAAFWRGDVATAAEIARVMWEQTYEAAAMHTSPPMAPDVWVNEAQLHAEIALALGDLDLADQQLTRIHKWIDHYLYVYRAEKIALFTGFGVLAGQRGQIEAARDYLARADALIYADEYPILRADLLYAVAKLEQATNQADGAIQAATQSYRAAWCDGISADGEVCYAYRRGLDRAAALLTDLGAPSPTLPPFDGPSAGRSATATTPARTRRRWWGWPMSPR